MNATSTRRKRTLSGDSFEERKQIKSEEGFQASLQSGK